MAAHKQVLQETSFSGIYLKRFLKMSLSMEYLPLPETNITMDKVKNTKASSFTWNGSFSWAIKYATDMVMKIGITDKRVRNPRNTSNPQKNSAKITRMKDSFAPMPMISLK
jgi:hypothetical protein